MTESQGVKILLAGYLVWAFLQFSEALGDVEDEIDHCTVRGTFDLKFAEKDVRLEVGERFVDDVILIGLRRWTLEIGSNRKFSHICVAQWQNFEFSVEF